MYMYVYRMYVYLCCEMIGIKNKTHFREKIKNKYIHIINIKKGILNQNK